MKPVGRDPATRPPLERRGPPVTAMTCRSRRTGLAVASMVAGGGGEAEASASGFDHQVVRHQRDVSRRCRRRLMGRLRRGNGMACSHREWRRVEHGRTDGKDEGRAAKMRGSFFHPCGRRRSPRCRCYPPLDRAPSQSFSSVPPSHPIGAPGRERFALPRSPGCFFLPFLLLLLLQPAKGGGAFLVRSARVVIKASPRSNGGNLGLPIFPGCVRPSVGHFPRNDGALDRYLDKYVSRGLRKYS
jgi:hypothetical protein